MLKKAAPILVALIIVAVGVAVFMGGAPAEKPRVRAATLQGGISTLDIMEAEGLDEKHGFELEVLRLQKTPDIMAALSKGDADLVVIPAEMAAKLLERGEKVVIVAVDMYQNQAVLATDPSIRSIEDLKGKVVGATVASGTYKMFKAYVRLVYGINVSETDSPGPDEIGVINVPPGSILDALYRGDVAAIVTWEPLVSKAITMLGAHVVASYQYLWEQAGVEGEPVMLVWVASQSFAEQSRGALEKFLAAREEAAKIWINEKDKVVAVLKSLYGLSEDEAETLYGRVRICATPLDQGLIDSIRSEWWLAWKGGYLQSDPAGIGSSAFYQP